MTEQDRYRLNAAPLTDVMLAWGFVQQTEARNGQWAGYLCPWHDDHHPSLVVDKVPRKGAADLGFKCMACGQQGFGAIQLAARLMGYPAGKLSPEEYLTVAQELAERLNIETEDYIPGSERLRSTVMGELGEFRAAEPQYAEWDGEQPIFEPAWWSVQALKALGVKIEAATRRVKNEELRADGESGRDTAEAEMPGGKAHALHSSLLTRFDPDTGEVLYRCSLGDGFYRDPKKAEVKTVAEWGKVLEEKFHVTPVSRFIIMRQNEQTGGRFVLAVRSTPNYPIFIFRYPWGIKKYEPLTHYGKNKWTWWHLADDADLEHRWYGDAPLEDLLHDGVAPEQDMRHPLVDLVDKDGKPTGKKIFERIVLCSGPRDAIALWSHSNAHVVWLHSEASGFDQKGTGAVRPNRWLRALVKKLRGVTADGGLYVCYDEDATGIAGSQAIALNDPWVRWLRLPKELNRIPADGKPSGRGCKDVTDFILHFQEVERMMPADVQHDDPVEWFDNALFDTPSCQFWQWESERKDADGKGRARYKFDLRNVPVFLRARGMVRKVMQQENDTISRFFVLSGDRTYTELFLGEKGSPGKLLAQARDLMAEWLRAHKEYNDAKGSLSRAIYSAKLEQGAMEVIEQVDFDDKSFGEDFDHFFFQNTAVCVTRDSIEAVPYSRMKWWTNSDAILEGRFTVIPQLWHVEENGFYTSELLKHEEILRQSKTAEERAQENMRWDQWATLWRYRLVLDRPADEMPVHFRFLYNTCRIFWEKEQTQELSKAERQAQDMYFIAMLHAIGSALVRFRSANRQQFIHITDNGTRREDLASGGTGKTAILEMLGLVRRVLKVDGKALEGGNIMLEQELGKVVPGLHNIVCIDELPQGFSPKKMYNYPLSLTSRGLYKGSVKLEGDDLPKFVVASNEQLDISSDSTARRDYQVLVSDWYHPRSMDGSRPSHTPADDFREQYHIKEVARNLPAALLNEARNLLLGCVQLFLQLPDETIRPPKDSRALLRQALAASKDEQFTRWIAGYLGDTRHLAIPIAQRELAISLLDYCGITVGEKTLKSAYKRLRDNLDDYLRTSVYVCNPPVVLLTATDREMGFRRTCAWQHPRNPDGSIPTDAHGNRLPRELDKKQTQRCYYFYMKSRIPRHFQDAAHIGDPDYVQPAPETDPEAYATAGKTVSEP